MTLCQLLLQVVVFAVQVVNQLLIGFFFVGGGLFGVVDAGAQRILVMLEQFLQLRYLLPQFAVFLLEEVLSSERASTAYAFHL